MSSTLPTYKGFAHRRGLPAATSRLVGVITIVVASISLAHEPDYPMLSATDAAHRMSAFIFPSEIETGGLTKAFEFRDSGYHFDSLEKINNYNVRSAHLIAGTAGKLQLDYVPLESPWWWKLSSGEEAAKFLKGLDTALRSNGNDVSSKQLDSSRNALQKALVQRDLFQIYSLILAARAHVDEDDGVMSADHLEVYVAKLLQTVLLSDSEYTKLRALIPKEIPAEFQPDHSFSLSVSYLPERAFKTDTTWVEIPERGTPFRHFQDYGGRSLIKVYMRAPQLGGEAILGLWRRLFERYGERLHATAVREETPAGLETMLVRTFGVFLTDGSWRDTFLPEEIIIRVFKNSTQSVDLATSDFRGTLFYQYKMTRQKLLEEPASLGLRRTLDDQEQFYGFFGDVPDPSNAYSNTVTTMRANCIGCHSELFYGLNTIFSFERDPAVTSHQDMLSPRARGGFHLTTPEAVTLRKLLESM